MLRPCLSHQQQQAWTITANSLANNSDLLQWGQG